MLEQIVSVSQDSTVRVWHSHSNNQCIVLRGHRDWITSLGMANRRIVTASMDSTVKVWDLEARPRVDKRALQKAAQRKKKKK